MAWSSGSEAWCDVQNSNEEIRDSNEIPIFECSKQAGRIRFVIRILYFEFLTAVRSTTPADNKSLSVPASTSSRSAVAPLLS
jgi:hypothetical protein